MTSVIAQIHIDTTSIAHKTLPTTPIPLKNNNNSNSNNVDQLNPSTELQIPLVNPSKTPNKSDQLASLAHSIDATRNNLNSLLTTWKDWAGKEQSTSSKSQTHNNKSTATPHLNDNNNNNNNNNDDDEDDDDQDDDDQDDDDQE
ncbi:uncharacterized protein MEPE_01440 [Melanopsichium pennsylvanicum]|uniref:Uncharacterized protein n=1 Tax=Melanopsichium pennsylvanicum TaxID=63383 RepID=A0AAJ4XHM4_9BASI|nr:uncharacterized protein MEPE_01440 [Melanopsichium pennsylvanicum]